jgi:hypothetical protein
MFVMFVRLTDLVVAIACVAKPVSWCHSHSRCIFLIPACGRWIFRCQCRSNGSGKMDPSTSTTSITRVSAHGIVVWRCVGYDSHFGFDSIVSLSRYILGGFVFLHEQANQHCVEEKRESTFPFQVTKYFIMPWYIFISNINQI